MKSPETETILPLLFPLVPLFFFFGGGGVREVGGGGELPANYLLTTSLRGSL